MRYLIDTNVIIVLLSNLDANVVRRASECDDDDIVTSSIAFAETCYGSFQGRLPSLDVLGAFVEEVPVLDFDRDAAMTYASLPFRRASFDRLIAAHALSRNLTLVTNNTRDFTDIPGLRVENWAQ
ncbi:twitching motility protein PilT [Sphingomonas sp. Leaf33]|uniref:type II toxin-antitoxin system VapC family toxin n=1 Tax=Sphingomonas sp. Leaf33 TaxID=1736215 RepID=UPI0006F270F8|nr:type II toxin-antitoxin system VapC family toxin [Sphingomonas sp. Leaf33]KQN25978.1 twitching motility protein PilT [Sphingomonas sp. Leaf33]